MSATKAKLADELLRRLAATIRSSQLYSPGHPIIAKNMDGLRASLQYFHTRDASVVVGLVGDEIIIDDVPIADAGTLGAIVQRLKDAGVERITIDRGVTADELNVFVAAIAELRRGEDEDTAPFPALEHIRVGRVTVARTGEGGLVDLAAIKGMYGGAVALANDVWDSADTEGIPDATQARKMIDGLARGIAQNRSGLLSLATLKNYDNYTFTHMVNVSILTMGQARAMGIDGPLLREFGLAALMHDIGKVKTPQELLNKTDKLSDKESEILRRHVVDGAEILRRTPDMPTLVPIVAFEHHLRLDGSGYPYTVTRPSLNLGTMLCSVADVYDAMRSQRAYQSAFPTDRILEVLKQNDGTRFDQHLVRRFSQLVGIYPVGNLVRLNTGEVAVVMQVYAPDPYRPRVRVLTDRSGKKLDGYYDLNLWDAAAESDQPSSVSAPVDPAVSDIEDPLSYLEI
jgi:putative nucleotidyltransferase with HDIG domain